MGASIFAIINRLGSYPTPMTVELSDDPELK